MRPHPILFATGAVAIAIIGVIVVGGFGLLPGPGGSGSGPTSGSSPAGSPTPSAGTPASPSPSSGAAGQLDTATWMTYTSNWYGFSIGHPADWTERPSDHVWTFPKDADWLNLATEGFIAPGQAILATAWSVPVAPGTTVDSWLQTYCPRTTKPCSGLQARSSTVSLDGHAGQLILFADDTQAFIVVGDRMYVVAVWEPDTDPRTTPYGGARRLLKAIVSTMRLLPGGPASSASARPS